MDSILSSVKTLLGLDPNYTPFDADLIMQINGVFVALNQIGVGDTVFSITGDDETWDDFLPNDDHVNMVKMYLYMKVRTVFDPPSGAAKESMENLIKEYEWRLSIEYGGGDE